MLKLLLDAGARLDSRDVKGWTSLLWRARSRSSVLQVLDVAVAGSSSWSSQDLVDTR